MLAVPRRYGRADYLPVIAWGQLAAEAGRLQVGDDLDLEGRIQSRTYHKVTDTGTEERVAYEVSMMHLL
jgi:single-stranded DNA-binding protein